MTQICQSCSMPMNDESLFGTNKDGSKNSDYCIYCYKNGEFIDDVSLQEYIEMNIPFAVQAGMTQEQMRFHCETIFPTLKRWENEVKETLNDLIVPAIKINKAYAKTDPKKWVWTNDQSEIFGENWRVCPSFPEYSASDFGRICITNSSPREILVPFENDKKYRNLTPKQLSDLLKSNVAENKNPSNFGWLKVKNKANDYENEKFVYELVADAWLIKPKTDKILHIHHKSNDGYDNRPQNLIYITENVHNKINHNKRATDDTTYIIPIIL